MTNTVDLPALALAWHDAGRAVAIATVVETWGSAPRGVGSQLIIDADGAMEGSVSGGCVEGAVITEALDAISDGQHKLLRFGVPDDDAFAVGLACGGEISVLVEPLGPVMSIDVLRAIVAARQARQPVTYVTSLSGGGGRMGRADDFADRFRLVQSGIAPDGDSFVAIHNPHLRMAIIGAVHIAQPLVRMARDCGYAPIIIDPRDAFGSAARFPDTTIINDWPDDALRSIGIDQRTAIVTLTHDPKLDDPAITVALGSEAFYLGCLGSKRTHAKRVDRLLAAGFTQDQIDQIDAPVGMDLGGRQPAEIAVSIMAQVTKTLRCRT